LLFDTYNGPKVNKSILLL